MSAIEPDYDLAGWRSEIPLLDHVIPLAACSQAPQTRRIRSALDSWMESWNERGMDWDAWMEEVEAARRAFAALINADPDEVAVTGSVSQAVSALASALDFSGSRRGIVSCDGEFPTVAHVWRAQQPRGALVTSVAERQGVVSLEDWRAAIDDRAAVVSVTHGCYESGFRQDLTTVGGYAREAGALLFVDAYQTLGTAAIDVKALGIDALAAGCLKYLMGFAGIAFLYVRRELAETLEPAVTGWFGRRNPYAFTPTLDWAAGARRFDTGTPPIPNAYVARAGIEMILEIGPDKIERWTDRLVARMIERGAERGLRLHGSGAVEQRTPSTTFLCPGDSHAVEVRLRERGIIASARGPVLRLAPHFYTSQEDVDRGVDALVVALGG